MFIKDFNSFILNERITSFSSDVHNKLIRDNFNFFGNSPVDFYVRINKDELIKIINKDKNIISSGIMNILYYPLNEDIKKMSKNDKEIAALRLYMNKSLIKKASDDELTNYLIKNKHKSTNNIKDLFKIFKLNEKGIDLYKVSSDVNSNDKELLGRIEKNGKEWIFIPKK